MPILRETLDLSADTPKSRHHENPPRFIIPLPLQSQMSEPVPAPMTDGILPIQEAWADITLRDAPIGYLLYIASTITPVAGIWVSIPALTSAKWQTLQSFSGKNRDTLSTPRRPHRLHVRNAKRSLLRAARTKHLKVLSIFFPGQVPLGSIQYLFRIPL